MNKQHKPAVRLQDTVQVGRIETLEDVLRMLSSLQDLSPVQRKLYGITQQRLREVIQKPARAATAAQETEQALLRLGDRSGSPSPKVEPKGRVMP